MQLSDFSFDLPDELIAHYPCPERSASRLLCLSRQDGSMLHRHFADLPEFLTAKDLLVFNDTRVIPARLLGCKESGGRIEALIERVLNDQEALAQVRASKSPKPGTRLLFEAERTEPLVAVVLGREGEFFHLRFETTDLTAQLEIHGHIPLPPYIQREDELADRERYQTVFSRHPGAVAAPTAGLHFDPPLLQRLRAMGVDMAHVTLHVGSGTFQPVRVENVLEHRMHSERIIVTEAVCEQIRACRARGGRVIAVGTTSVRTLESAARRSTEAALIDAYAGETDIFIYPGFEFRIVDAMITNFHLSASTLMMLVSAFAGREHILEAYREAVRQRYRFFSYGDAMLLY